MSKVAILTDSNSGITQAQSKELGVKVIPMPFFIDGEQYYEDICGCRCLPGGSHR